MFVGEVTVLPKKQAVILKGIATQVQGEVRRCPGLFLGNSWLILVLLGPGVGILRGGNPATEKDSMYPGRRAVSNITRKNILG